MLCPFSLLYEGQLWRCCVNCWFRRVLIHNTKWNSGGTSSVEFCWLPCEIFFLRKSTVTSRIGKDGAAFDLVKFAICQNSRFYISYGVSLSINYYFKCPQEVSMFRTIIRRCSSLESTMVRVLNVAEKNDAAKSLSELMSRGRYRRVSFSHISRIERFVDYCQYWYRRRFAPKTVGTHKGRLVPHVHG